MMDFSPLPDTTILSRTARPEGAVSVVVDTDTYNEIDDQYALSYALRAENITVEAVYAAPFHNKRSKGPEDGMERSFEEIQRLAAGLRELDPAISFPAFKGSRRYLHDSRTPVASEAVDDLVDRARARNSEDPLYVVAIGAPTNVASAILTEPDIREKIVVVWLGGQPYDWHTAWEFNLKQDVVASRILFDSGVPLVHVPCKNVAEHLRISQPELERYLQGRGPVADYLYRITVELMKDHGILSKIIWDMAPVAWLRGLVHTHLCSSPLLTDQLTWSVDRSRHLLRVAYDLDRDAIFRDALSLLGGEI